MQKYSYRKLRGRIVEIYGTMEAFSRELRISKVSMSNKMNGKSNFSQSDMERWGTALDIPTEEYGLYFFT